MSLFNLHRRRLLNFESTYTEIPENVYNLRKTASPATVLNFAWNSALRTEYYKVRVYYYVDNVNWELVEVVNTTTTDTNFSVSGLSDSRQAFVEVTAVNSIGESVMAELYTTSGAVLPPSIHFDNIGLDSLTIGWSGGVGSTFRLIKQVDANPATTILTSSSGGGTYTDSNLNSGFGYGYYFEVVSSTGTLVYSLGINATVGKYYIDSVVGSDDDDGKQSSPWRTLNKLNTYNLPDSAEIYLRGGQTHQGKIIGQQGLKYRSYGTGKAIVSSGIDSGFVGTNISNTIIDSIIFEGSGSSTNTGNGIEFINNQAGNTKLPNISILNSEVRGYKTYGIAIAGQNVSSGFDNVLIENTVVHDVLRGGITSYGEFDANKTTYAHSNITVKDCEVYNIHGNAEITNTHTGNPIVLSDVQHSVIEYCTAHDSAQDMNWSGGGAVGIWYWDADDVVIQNCTAYNMSSGLTNKDGAGFDLDGGVTNGIMRYNYSRNNDGGGFIIGQFSGARPMNNILMHHNISDNDAVKYGASILLFSGTNNMTGIEILNNTVYQNNQTDKVLDTLVWNGGSLGNPVITNNLLYGAIPSTTGLTMTTNWTPTNGVPQLVDPTAGNAEGFKLQETSPLIDAGTTVALTTDYFGNTIPSGSTYDIGAHEYQVTVVDPEPEPTEKWYDAVVDTYKIRVNNDSGILEDETALRNWFNE